MFNKRKSPILMLFSIFLIIGFAISTTAVNAAADKQMLLNIQQAIKTNKANWSAGENKITRMPLNEQLKLLGWLPEPESNLYEYGVDIIDEYTFPTQLPAAMDWRNRNGKNYMTPVKDQDCGDCWAFSAAAALEGRLAIDGHPGLDLSEQFLVSDCCSSGSCAGGYIVSTSRFLTTVGIPLESCYPYRGQNSTCKQACSDWENKTIKATRFARVNQTVAALKAALVNRGPINAGYMVYQDFMSYKEGIYAHSWGNKLRGHGVVIVGYNDAQQCFIVKNSWGLDWGENGYFRIAYSQVNNEVNFGADACVYGDDIKDSNPQPLPLPVEDPKAPTGLRLKTPGPNRVSR